MHRPRIMQVLCQRCTDVANPCIPKRHRPSAASQTEGFLTPQTEVCIPEKRPIRAQPVEKWANPRSSARVRNREREARGTLRLLGISDEPRSASSPRPRRRRVTRRWAVGDPFRPPPAGAASRSVPRRSAVPRCSPSLVRAAGTGAIRATVSLPQTAAQSRPAACAWLSDRPESIIGVAFPLRTTAHSPITCHLFSCCSG